MSETTTTEAPQDAPEATQADAAPPEQQTTQEPQSDATEAAQTDTEPKSKEPPWFMKRINDMTRRNAEVLRELELAKAELEIARRGREMAAGDTTDQTTKPPVSVDEAAIQAAAKRLRDEERANEARSALISNGVKELGADTWNERTQMLAAMGAQDNPAFMDALLELPDAAPKLIATLTDEPERLSALLAKRPAALAAELGVMAAALTAAKPRALSAAPAPVQPVRSPRQVAAPDIYDPKMTPREFIALRNKTAPPHLGGPRRRSA